MVSLSLYVYLFSSTFPELTWVNSADSADRRLCSTPSGRGDGRGVATTQLFVVSAQLPQDAASVCLNGSLF